MPVADPHLQDPPPRRDAGAYSHTDAADSFAENGLACVVGNTQTNPERIAVATAWAIVVTCSFS